MAFVDKKEIKIAVDCRLLNKKQNTGISRYTEFLIEYYISRFGNKNVSLITNDKMFDYYECPIIYSKLKPFNFIHFLSYANFIKKNKIEFLHVPFYSCFYKKNKNVKSIVTVHDLMFYFVKDFFGENILLNKIKFFYFDFIVKKTLLNANVILSVSGTTQKDVFKYYGYNSIHIPEDSEILQLADYSILDKFNLKEKKFFFYCGNNRPHKNIDFIIDVFANNLNLPPLVLAGKGHKNFRNVIATGIITDEELRALYKSAIAFVFPSKCEGFGLPILEAIRSETLVVASNIPAFMEFKTRNIYFFELGDEKDFLRAIKETLSNDFSLDKEFLNYYDKKIIYELNDLMVNNLLELN